MKNIPSNVHDISSLHHFITSWNNFRQGNAIRLKLGSLWKV
jgi:hypothetical protein